MTESGEWWHQLLGDTFPSVESLCEGFNEFLHGLTSSFTPLPASVSGRVEECSSAGVPCDIKDCIQGTALH